jgi:hypothetical protein
MRPGASPDGCTVGLDRIGEESAPRIETSGDRRAQAAGKRLQSGVMVGTSFDAVLFLAGLLSASASVSAAQCTADSAGDGLPALLDYALGWSLIAPDAAPASDVADGQLRLAFTRDTRVP